MTCPALPDTPVPSPLPIPRFERLDALRGAAMLWMAAFHFCYDLNHFQLIHQNFHRDPFWTLQRTCIVSLFLFCAGAGQALAWRQGQGWRRFWRRWAEVAGCALLVTLGSWWMFPASYIHFGVLHGIAVMLVVTRLTAPAGRWLWPLGLLALLLPQLWTHPLFDQRATDWIGLYTRKPVTEDHVPLLPWLGVMWWGMAAGQWLTRTRAPTSIRTRPHWLTDPLPRALAPLAVLGRWSLTFYMLHQPVLLGALAAWMHVTASVTAGVGA